MLYYAENFMQYKVFLYILCFIAEIWIAFSTVYLPHVIFVLYVYSRAGNLLIGFLSKLLVFSKKTSE